MKITFSKKLILCLAFSLPALAVANERNPFEKPEEVKVESKKERLIVAKEKTVKQEKVEPKFIIKPTYEYKGSINGMMLYYDTAIGKYVKDTTQIASVVGGEKATLELDKIKF